MKHFIADVYRDEQEYYGELIAAVRNLVRYYIENHVETSETGMLRYSGGITVYREELLELVKKEVSLPQEPEFREGFRKQLKILRECAVRSTRSGHIIVLEYLFRLFHLDEFEAYLVILSLCCELDHDLEMAFAGLAEHTGVRMPTVALAVRMYTADRGEQRKLQKQFIQRRNVLQFLFAGLSETEGETRGREWEGGFFEQGLKLEYRILSYLQDYESVDGELDGLIQYGYPKAEKQELLIHQSFADGMDRLKKHTDEENVCIFLYGEHGAGKKMQAAKFCKRHGMSVLLVHAERLPQDFREQQAFFKRVIREAILQGNAAICICDLEKDPMEEKINREKAENILWGLRAWRGTLLLTSRYEWNHKIEEQERKIHKLFLPETTTEERILLWQKLLSKGHTPEDMSLEFLADKYVLSAGAVKNCIEEYESRLRMEGKEADSDLLLEACRSQIDHRLGKDAVRIPVQYTWEDLVLPEPQKNMLRDACDQVLLHHQVYRRWEFDRKVAYGKGVSMIFYGPPGTGKTMGAQVIANMLKLELYKVDMAGVMSKYVGESEKKLGNIFEQAKKSQSILFFDEADVLFGKRTEQKDSNDKYSNASTAYLLQKIEEYEGIIILATNFLQNFDNAFLRRFKFIIEFPFTDEMRRKEIWQKVFPEKMPKEELDIAYLAKEFRFSGSQIKNVAVAATFLAAGEQVPLNMRHLLIAVKRELAKTGKTMIASDFGPYYYLMETQEG